MNHQENQNDNQPDRNKINNLLQKLNNATEAERQIIVNELELEIFQQFTEKQKKEIRNYIKLALKYHEQVVVPTQNFVYTDKSIEKNINSIQEISLKTFKFNTVILQNNELIKIPKQAKYYLEDLGDGIILEMVYIPAGSFLMGTSQTVIETDEYFYCSNEPPKHLVSLDALKFLTWISPYKAFTALIMQCKCV